MTRHQGGVTLIELVVALAVAAVVFGWAIPSMMGVINQNALTAASNQYVGLINHARSEALERGDRVRISPLSNNAGSNDWSYGALLWHDANNDDTHQDKETIRQIAFDRDDLAVNLFTGTAPYGFDGAGFAIDDVAYAFRICSPDVPGAGQEISVNQAGQIQSDSTNSCKEAP